MIYLDNASTSFPKPAEVSAAIHEYLTYYGVSPGRGTYQLAGHADALVHKTRVMLSQILEAPSENSLVFTGNATHSLNLAIKGTLKPGDHALICSYSHNSTIRPLETLKRNSGVSYDIIEVGLDGSIDIQKVHNAIKPNTRLACFTHASNVIGVVAEYEKAASLLQSKNIPVLLDCTQSLGYTSLSLQNIPVDFLAGTGHKTLLGPTGIGFLYVRNHKLLDTMMEGGSGGNFSLSPFHPNQMPYKFEAGTPNTTCIAGLQGALEYIQQTSFETIAERSMAILSYALEKLLQFDEVTVYGSTPAGGKKIPILSFTISGTLPSELAYHYNEAGICIRSGTQCAPLIHRTLNTLPTGTVRLGIGHYNSYRDIDAFIKTTERIIREASHAKISTRFHSHDHTESGTAA